MNQTVSPYSPYSPGAYLKEAMTPQKIITAGLASLAKEAGASHHAKYDGPDSDLFADIRKAAEKLLKVFYTDTTAHDPIQLKADEITSINNALDPDQREKNGVLRVLHTDEV